MFRLSGTLLICFVVVLVGCGGKPTATPEAVEVTSTPTSEVVEPTNTPTFSPTATEPPEAPISPVEAPDSPIPTPTPEVSLGPPPPLVVPTPAAGLGVVTGTIKRANGSPIGDAPVRLGVIVWFDDKEGEEGIVVADRGRAPQTVSDAWGRFVIVDVEPDTYGLGVHEINSDGLFFIPGDTGDTILQVEVKADSTLDLGEIEVIFPAGE
jgi:hypothetical protein